MKHYYHSNRKIIGLEYDQYALKQLRKSNPDIPMIQAEARYLPSKKGVFEAVLVFGVIPSVEDGPEKVVEETARILKPNGIICTSSKNENLVYYLHMLKQRFQAGGIGSPIFYKWLFKNKEWKDLSIKDHFQILSMQAAFYSPLLYRFSIFKDKPMTEVKLAQLRSSGYPLNRLGWILDRFFTQYLSWLYQWTLFDLVVARLK